MSLFPWATSSLLPGEVALVGAGPGDPELLTVKALNLISQADVVVYDRLVSAAIMALLPEATETIYAGKYADNHILTQEQINNELVTQAQSDKRVVRLKGGDPFIFGRGGEELEVLIENNIQCHIVPGITAASGCATYAAMPLTHRNLSLGCTMVTGHSKSGESDLPWQHLAGLGHTLVFYMGLKALPNISENLQKYGLSADTPAAVIEKGTTPEQKVVVSTLAGLPQQVTQHNIKPPTLVVVGEITALSEQLSQL